MNAQKRIHGKTEPSVLPQGRVAKLCPQCGLWFSLPRCHAKRHTCCSQECLTAKRAKTTSKRSRACKVCSTIFTPRPGQLKAGGGLYCSMRCVSAGTVHLRFSPEANKKRAASFRRALDSGSYKPLRGPDNPQHKGRVLRDGYVWIWHDGEYVAEHRIVAEEMLERPLLETEVVHHKNGKKDDNRPENLEVMTRAQHMDEHRSDVATARAKAKRVNGIKLTVNEAREIRDALEEGMSVPDLAREYNVTPATIYHIRSRATWATA